MCLLGPAKEFICKMQDAENKPDFQPGLWGERPFQGTAVIPVLKSEGSTPKGCPKYIFCSNT